MIQIRAEYQTPIDVAQIARYAFSTPCETVLFNPGTYRFDMCVTPRNGFNLEMLSELSWEY